MLAEAAKQTFGMLLPAYDRPQTLERVRAWFESARRLADEGSTGVG